MCLLLLALNIVPDRPWLLLGNRDEFHARATAPAQVWESMPAIVGGRDLQAGGSWLALNRNGRYAAVTNVRDGMPKAAPRSRGELVGNFVAGADSPQHYAQTIAARRTEYGPFNLVVGNLADAALVSSIDGIRRPLGSGIHLFSNGLPTIEWPKMRRLRGAFSTMLQSGKVLDEALLDLLLDSHQPDGELPDTGVGAELERRLAPIFLRGENYGTRAGTLAYARANGSLCLRERRFGPNGVLEGESLIELGG
jgi:uncharacterized protein with NRDE domain